MERRARRHAHQSSDYVLTTTQVTLSQQEQPRRTRTNCRVGLFALLHSVGKVKELEDLLPTLRDEAAYAYVRALKLLGRETEAIDFCNEVCF